MTLQELARLKSVALSPDATMWEMRQSLCHVAVEHEWLMHTHAALRESVVMEKAKNAQICDIEAAISGSGNGLAAPSNAPPVGIKSAPMKHSIYSLVRRLTRWAA